MQRRSFAILSIVLLLVGFLAWTIQLPAQASDLAQLPTVAIATVTGTPTGAFITVKMDQEQINVRSGPNTNYPKVGVLLPGQTAPAKGRSEGGLWIMIEYAGVPGGTAWVYAALVNLSGGNLPIVEPPPLPTAQYTQTIDPTLAAQFIVTSVPTRLPTYTAPPPLSIPTFVDQSAGTQGGGVPMGLVIIILAGVGLIVGLFSLSQGR